jgi:hypothetical protein
MDRLKELEFKVFMGEKLDALDAFEYSLLKDLKGGVENGLHS